MAVRRYEISLLVTNSTGSDQTTINQYYMIVLMCKRIVGLNCFGLNLLFAISGLEIKKILRSPFGDQLEKYSHWMQILVASLFNVNDAAQGL